MRHRFQANLVFLLLITIATVPTAWGEMPILDEAEVEPLRIGVDFNFIEQEFDESQILSDIATPIMQVLFGGTSVIESVTEFVELVFEAAFEGEMAEDELNEEDAIEQLRPMMISELYFVRLACPDLPMEHRMAVRTAAEMSLNNLAVKSALTEPTAEQEETLGVLADTRPDSLSEIRATITNSLRTVLSDVQFRKYEEMAADRVSQRRQAAILACVSGIDGQLLLTSQQRENIIEAISSSWQSRWEQWAMMPGVQFDYIPELPAELVTNFLNETQKSAWQTLQKSDFEEMWADEDAVGPWNDGWWGEVVPNDEEPGEGIQIEKRPDEF